MTRHAPRHHRRHLLTRRRFLTLTAGASSLLVLGACGDDDDAPETTPTPGQPSLTATATASVEPTPRPSPTPTPAPTPDASLIEKAGQMVMAGFRGTSLTADNPFVRDLQKYHLGGAILFSYDVPLDQPVRNIESPEQLQQLTTQLQDLAPSPLLIAVDQEGGVVARLNEDHGFPPTLSAEELTALGDPAATRAHAIELAATIAAAGATIDMAPVVDVNVNPTNPVIGALGRSFSSDRSVVVTQASAFINGLHDEGILSALKHFPGHGSSTADSHLGFVNVTDTWSPQELIPFEEIVAAGLADAVMVGHLFNANLDPNYPATLSEATIQGILRDEIGFEGVVFSDDMQMGAITSQYGFEEAIQLAVNAGIDMLVINNNLEYDVNAPSHAVETIVRLVEDGTVPESRVNEAYTRIHALKNRMGAVVESP